MGIIDKIKAIEEEMARTQKNKATEHHLGLLKGKLARYRQQLLADEAGSGGGGGSGFEVAKSGDARVVLIGYPPSVSPPYWVKLPPPSLRSLIMLSRH